MIIIRLNLKGRKKKPFYQIIVTDSRKARNGKFIENLGFYNPHFLNNILNINIKFDRILYWIKKGAIISNRVYTIINKIK